MEPAALIAEGQSLVTDAAAAALTFRLLGSAGVGLHCPPAADFLQRHRRYPKDIDLVCHRADRRHVRKFFSARGYEVDRDVLVAMEGERYIFRHPAKGFEVDLWVDRLDFCHTIELRDRLGFPGPSLAIEDLLLSKLQIVEPTPGDDIDAHAILFVHPVGSGPGDPEVVDAGYVARLLADDWGFWRTATTNLDRLAGGGPAPEVAAGLAALSEAAAIAPKSVKWKLRARVGERRQWWQQVDLPRETY